MCGVNVAVLEGVARCVLARMYEGWAGINPDEALSQDVLQEERAPPGLAIHHGKLQGASPG